MLLLTFFIMEINFFTSGISKNEQLHYWNLSFSLSLICLSSSFLRDPWGIADGFQCFGRKCCHTTYEPRKRRSALKHVCTRCKTFGNRIRKIKEWASSIKFSLSYVVFIILSLQLITFPTAHKFLIESPSTSVHLLASSSFA